MEPMAAVVSNPAADDVARSRHVLQVLGQALVAGAVDNLPLQGCVVLQITGAGKWKIDLNTRSADGQLSEISSSTDIDGIDSVGYANPRVFLELLNGKLSPLAAIQTGSITIKGSMQSMRILKVLFESYKATQKRSRELLHLLPKLYWSPESTNCELCNATFKLTVRAHHCRFCGKCVCHSCSRLKHQGHRMCDSCSVPPLDNLAVFIPSSTPAVPVESTPGSTRVGSRAGSLGGSRAPSARSFGSFSEREDAASQNGEQPDGEAAAVHVMEAAAGNSTVEAAVKASEETAAQLKQLDSLQTEVNSLSEYVASAGVGKIYEKITISYIAISLMLSLWTLALWGGNVASAVAAGLCAVYAAFRAFPQNSHFRRLRALGTAAVILLGLRAVRKATAGMSDEDSERVWDAANMVYARFAFEQMGALKAFWIKIAQYLSARADVMPKQYIRELAKLQDSTPPSDPQLIRRTLESAFGKSVSAAFESFEEKPIASASIAQVHRAKLKEPASVLQFDGNTVSIKDVVVKIQHPGIASIMRSDLLTLSFIVRAVAFVEPEFDFRPVVDEWAKEAIKELDFNREGAIMTHVGRVLHRCECYCRVPLLVPVSAVGIQSAEPAFPHIMLQEFVDGCKISDMLRLQSEMVDRRRLFEDICHAFAVQMLVDGCFNADPHGGNILVELPSANSSLTRARPVILDFGLSKLLSSKLKLAFALMVASASSLDASGLLDAFDDMGLRLNREAPGEDLEMVQFMLRSTDEPDSARKVILNRRKVVTARIEKRRALKQKRPVDSWPQELLLFLRSSELLHGLGALLRVQVNYQSIMSEYAAATLRCHNIALLREPGNNAYFPKVSYQHASTFVPLESVQDYRELSLEAAVAAADIPLARNWKLIPATTLLTRPLGSTLEEKLLRLLHSDLLEGKVTGAQVHVIHRSNTIAALSVGILGSNDPRPVNVDTLFPCFSVTKGLMAALLHALLEKGAAKKYLPVPAAEVGGEYQLPLTSFWPTFVRDGTSAGSIKAKQRITIEDVLTHRSGMQHAIPHDLTMTKFCSLWAMIEAMEVASPAHEPGTFTSYHYYTYGWLIAGIIHHLLGSSATEGPSIGKLLREVLLEPMGVTDEIFLGLPVDVQEQLHNSGRLAVLGGNFADRQGDSQTASALAGLLEAAGSVTLAEDDASRDMAALASLVQAMSTKMYLLDPRLFNRAAYRAAEIPAANAHCSARGLCTFYDKLGYMLEPASDAPTLISKERLLLAIQQRSSDNQELGLLPAERRAKFGLGFQLYPYVSDAAGVRPGWSGAEHEVTALPARSARLPAFGHNGFGGSVAFHDPNLQLSVAITVNQLSGQQHVTKQLLAAIWDTVKSVP